MKIIPENRIGFQPSSLRVYRIYNFAMAAFLFLILLPLLLIISIALLATQGRNIFYRGERLGKDQKVFQIFKFRTLCNVRARELTHDRTLPANSNIETPLGGILRESRLDELPQLINVMIGDMNLCGPRPVRADIATLERARIPFYDLRFRVKPGLIGPTQAYFGHGACKSVRARMNNRLVNQQVSILAELALLERIAMSVLTKIGGKFFKLHIRSASPISLSQQRDIFLTDVEGKWLSTVEHMTAHGFTAPSLPARLVGETIVVSIRLQSGGVRKARITLLESAKHNSFSYAAKNSYSHFVIERYALGHVVVPPKVGMTRIEHNHPPRKFVLRAERPNASP